MNRKASTLTVVSWRPSHFKWRIGDHWHAQRSLESHPPKDGSGRLPCWLRSFPSTALRQPFTYGNIQRVLYRSRVRRFHYGRGSATHAYRFVISRLQELNLDWLTIWRPLSWDFAQEYWMQCGYWCLHLLSTWRRPIAMAWTQLQPRVQKLWQGARMGFRQLDWKYGERWHQPKLDLVEGRAFRHLEFRI